MSQRGRDWRTILLAVGCAAGTVLAMTLSASMGFYAALTPGSISLGQAGTTALDVLVPASAILFMGALAIPAAYYSISYLAGAADPTSLPPRLRVWEGIVLFVLWITSGLLAGYLVDKEPWKWLTPGLYLAAIGIPVYFVIRLAAGGLSVGSVRRFWGLLSTGMVAGPGLAIFLELGAAGVIAVGVVIYLALNPALLPPLEDLATQLSRASTLDQTVSVLSPLLNSPMAFVLALLFFSGFAPIVEEASKSLAVWAVFDRLGTAAQGFLAGALSGAGFGLLESLLASATPDQSWALTLLVRGGSSMMHIMAASLTGWGIARFRLSKRLAPLITGYAVAVVLHSLWNASVITITFGGLRATLGASGVDVASTALIALGGTLFGVLCLSIPLTLASINRRLRSGLATPPAEPLFAPPSSTVG